MNGTQLCCKFSGITNRLKYCGPTDAYKKFKNIDEAKESLKKFEGLYPYLKLIGEKHNLEPFDYKVVEAYWLGNKLLDAFTAEDFKKFLPELGKRGLPQNIVTELQQKVPKAAIPHHTFNVLFVGVGRITGSVETNIENINNCMVSWGKVIGKGKIRGPILNERLELTETERDAKGECAIGDNAAMHWGEIVHVLSEEQLKNLEKYTKKVIEAVKNA